MKYFKVLLKVTQGCPLLPMLFNLYIEESMNHLQGNERDPNLKINKKENESSIMHQKRMQR